MDKRLKVFIAIFLAVFVFMGIGVYALTGSNNVNDTVEKEKTEEQNNVQFKEKEETSKNSNEDNVPITGNVQNVPTGALNQLDSTAPEVEVKYSTKESSKEVEVVLESNEELKELEDWTLSDDSKKLSRVFNENVDIDLSVYDLSNNETLVNVKIENIDTVPPVISIKDNFVGKDNVYSNISFKLYDNYGINKVVINGKQESKMSVNQWGDLNFASWIKYVDGENSVELFDVAGNSTVIKFTLDLEKPKLYLNGDSKVTLEGGVDTYTELGAKVVDNVDGTIDYLEPVKINYSVDGKFKATVDKVDTSKLGTYKIVYKYTDKSGNVGVDASRSNHDYVMRVVNVVDTTKPKLYLNGDSKVTLEGGVDTYTELGAKVVDNIDDTIEYLEPVKINYSVDGKFKGTVDKVDTSKLGTYKISYKYTDKSGNVGVDASRSDHNYVMRVVNVVDTTKPVITPVGVVGRSAYELRVESGSKVSVDDVLATVTDNIDKTSKIKPYKADLLIGTASENTYNYDFSEGFNTRYIGRYNIYYKYKDASGNEATSCLLLIMNDTTDPVIEVPGVQNRLGAFEYKVERGKKVSVNEIKATVTDNVDDTKKIKPYKADLLIGSASENTYNYDFSDGFVTNKVGRYNLYYSYTDKAGHKVEAGLMIVINDSVKPEVVDVKQTRSLTEEFTNVSFKFSEEVKEINGINVGKVDSYVLQLKPGKQTINFKDLAGNSNTYEVTVIEPEDKAIYLYTKADLLSFVSNNNSGEVSYANKTIKLGADIDLTGETWVPIDAWNGKLNKTIFDGNSHTIKNMRTSGSDKESGFIRSNASSITIKNIIFDGAYIKTLENASQSYAGVVMGKNYSATTFENITIKNSRVENNWQSGGLVGFAEGNKQTFKNCKVEDSFVGGANATSGTFFGLGIVNVDVIDSSAKNVQLYTDGLTWNSTQKVDNKFFVGHVYHTKGSKQTVTNSTEENVTIVIATADEFVNTFADGGKGLENTSIELINDIDLAGKNYKAADNVAFTLDGNNHTIKNLSNTTSSNAGGLLNSLASGKSVTVTNVILDNATISSNSSSQVAVGGFIGQADTAKNINISNSVIKNSSISNGDGWTGGYVGYTAGYDVKNNGPVYSTVVLSDVSFVGNSISGTGSVGGIVGHSGGNPDTSTTINNCIVNNCIVTGPNNKNKTGLVVGTAHVGKTYINNYSLSNNTLNVTGSTSTSEIYGRFVPGETGVFKINGKDIS